MFRAPLCVVDSVTRSPARRVRFALSWISQNLNTDREQPDEVNDGSLPHAAVAGEFACFKNETAPRAGCFFSVRVENDCTAVIHRVGFESLWGDDDVDEAADELREGADGVCTATRNRYGFVGG